MPSTGGGTEIQSTLAHLLTPETPTPQAKVTWNHVVCDILVPVNVGICKLILSFEGTAGGWGLDPGGSPLLKVGRLFPDS